MKTASIATLISAALLCGMTQRTFAQASAPANPSATATAPAFQPNWDTPAQAYATWAHAMFAHDGKTMQQSVAWEKPQDGELVGLMNPEQTGAKEGREACDLLEAQFPADAQVKAFVKSQRQAYDAIDPAKSGAEVLRSLEPHLAKAQTKIDGENATLTIPDVAEPLIKFKKIDGKWKLLPESVGMPYAPQDEETRQEMAKSAKLSFRMFDLRREAYVAFIKDLKAKKYATGKDALDAVQNLEMDVMKNAMKGQTPGD